MERLPVFVFDGDCGFCTSSVRLLRRWVPTRVRVTPWQRVDLALLGLTRAECEEAVQWVGADGTRSAGSDAVARLLGTSHRAWRIVGAALLRRPVAPLAQRVYRLVAANRHRFPGGTPACALPAPAAGDA